MRATREPDARKSVADHPRMSAVGAFCVQDVGIERPDAVMEPQCDDVR
jgi:hypothetical protein